MSKVRGVKKRILVNTIVTLVLLSGLLVFPSSATSSWSRARPSSYVVYDETIGSADSNGVASIGLGVQINDYVPRAGSINYDMVRLSVSASANTRVGIQYDVFLT